MGQIAKSLVNAVYGIQNKTMGIKEPKNPDPPAPAPGDPQPSPVADVTGAPDMNTARANLAADDAAMEQEKLRKKGRASTVLTGELGSGTPQTATKALLGD